MSNGNINLIALILSLLALFLAGFLFWRQTAFNRLKKVFFEGRRAQDLEAVLLELVQKLHLIEQEKNALEASLADLKTSTTFSLQQVGVHRFNPFADGGGNFSFCLALLDAHDTGVVITSMHGREQNRIYAKQLVRGQSETQLTEEEEQAIALAKHRLS
ncbi:MAG: DUF4446 family protein [Patescibacteria group bacterium]|nr:DUF4446 family protein [Patescibacteria group bacterium]